MVCKPLRTDTEAGRGPHDEQCLARTVCGNRAKSGCRAASTGPAGHLLSRIRCCFQEPQIDGRRQVDRLKITEKAQNNKHKDWWAIAHKMMDAGILLSSVKPVFSHNYNSGEGEPGCCSLDKLSFSVSTMEDKMCPNKASLDISQTASITAFAQKEISHQCWWDLF